MDNTNKTKIILGIAILVLIVWFLDKILKRLGIIKTADKMRVEENINKLREVKYFNPVEHQGQIFKKLSESEVEKYAKQIGKAVRGWGTDEELLFSTIKQFWNRFNISQVAEKYYKIFKSDMKSDIMNDLNDKEKSDLMKVINSLPEKS